MSFKTKTIADLSQLKKRGQKIAVITAYDYTFARIFDDAGVDAILVGDSLGSVIQGEQHTIPVTLEEMIYHARIVARGVKSALVIGDLPFMSYQLGPKEALISAGRFLKEGNVSAVKLEGGKSYAPHVRRIVKAGIPVMGHVGLLPQSVHAMGGYRVQGKSKLDAEQIFEDALSLQDAGAFAIVLESIPRELAERITRSLEIPTIGIGAGEVCSGQVLVSYDLLGLTQFSDGRLPKFVRQYASLGEEVRAAVAKYVAEVKEGTFPGVENCYVEELVGSGEAAPVKH